MNNKKIIGLVGEIGGGKGTVVEKLKEILSGQKVAVLKFSGILSDILDILHLEKSRHNLQQLAIHIDQIYGEGTFANAMKQRILNTDADIVIVDGVRWPADERVMHELDGIIVYITADQKVRYERVIGRKEKAGEESTTFEEFIEQQTKKNETFIQDIGSRADFKIENNGSLNELEEQIEIFVNKFSLKQ